MLLVIKGAVLKVMFGYLVHHYAVKRGDAESVFIEKFDARNVLVDGKQHLIVRVEGVEERIKRFIVFAESNYAPGASVVSVEVKDYG